ncbi:AAA family ATPase [Paludisphaera soli]|uniref:AAA family ATPase n=1 Tax=Paludisphaera soli TaxID=2712865 RepID=UPI0013EAA6CF|nr:AAA family ATPase [Paludisphaera soli]
MAELSDAELGLRWGDAEDEGSEAEPVIDRLATPGQLTILAADGGAGKSQLALRIAADASAGRSVSDEIQVERPLRILIVSGEDQVKTSLRPRLRAYGADMAMIGFADASVTTLDEAGDAVAVPVTIADRDYWDSLLTRTRPDVLVVDPLPNYLPNGASSNDADHVTAAVAPFLATARRHGTAVIGVAHLAKAKDRRGLAGLLRGSTAWSALARRVFLLALTPGAEGSGVVVHVKCNEGPKIAPFGYRFAPLDPATAVRPGTHYTPAELRAVARLSIIQLDGPVDRDDAEAAFDGVRPKGRPASVGPGHARWLAKFLAASPGREATQTAIVEAAGEAGHLGEPIGVRLDGRTDYRSINPLYRARDGVPMLGGQWAGAEVRCRGRAPAYWTLVLPAVPPESTPHEPTAGAPGPQGREEAAEEPSTSPSATGG